VPCGAGLHTRGFAAQPVELADTRDTLSRRSWNAGHLRHAGRAGHAMKIPPCSPRLRVGVLRVLRVSAA
jgi:hypothetical protein